MQSGESFSENTKKFLLEKFQSKTESRQQNKPNNEKTKLPCQSPAGSMPLFIRGIREEQTSCPCCSFCRAANGATHRCCQLSALCRTPIKTNYCLHDFSECFSIF